MAALNILQLDTFLERIEALEADIADAYVQAGALGFDVAQLRDLVAARSDERAARAHTEASFDAFMDALGIK